MKVFPGHSLWVPNPTASSLLLCPTRPEAGAFLPRLRLWSSHQDPLHVLPGHSKLPLGPARLPMFHQGPPRIPQVPPHVSRSPDPQVPTVDKLKNSILTPAPESGRPLNTLPCRLPTLSSLSAFSTLLSFPQGAAAAWPSAPAPGLSPDLKLQHIFPSS